MMHIAQQNRPLPEEINSSNEKIAIMLLKKLLPLKEIRERSNNRSTYDEMKELPQLKIKPKKQAVIRPKIRLENMLNRLTVSPSSFLPFELSPSASHPKQSRIKNTIQTEHVSLVIRRSSLNYLQEIKSDKLEEKKFMDVFNKAEQYLREKKNELKQQYLKENGKTFMQSDKPHPKPIRPIKLITNRQLQKMLLKDAKLNLQTMDISKWTKDIKRKRLMQLKVKTQMMDH